MPSTHDNAKLGQKGKEANGQLKTNDEKWELVKDKKNKSRRRKQNLSSDSLSSPLSNRKLDKASGDRHQCGATIHCVGEPETESEAKAIRLLAASLPSSYHLLHNFELCIRAGEMAYEYDIVVVGTYCLFHVEVKGYRGRILGDKFRWKFQSNGHVFPSPIPLANKKSKIIASKLMKSSFGRRHKSKVPFVDTILLITDESAQIRIRQEDQVNRVLKLGSPALLQRLTDPCQLPKTVHCDFTLTYTEQMSIVQEILGTNPVPRSPRLTQIGLYRVMEKIAQYNEQWHNVVVYLASHKYIHTRPKTILKVFQFDLYSANRDEQLTAIFHDQEALRIIGSHPHIISSGDFFAIDGHHFVLPHEYLEYGKTLEELLETSSSNFLTWPDKLYIMECLAKALLHCHKHGVIHRDVKPHCVVVAPPPGKPHVYDSENKNEKNNENENENNNKSFSILEDIKEDFETTIQEDLTLKEDEKVSVKLVNFDLARILCSNILLTDVRERLDPHYSAPELWEDPLTGASFASDVFSLGLLFYRLITDNQHVPFEHLKELKHFSGVVPLDTSLFIDAAVRPATAFMKGNMKGKTRLSELVAEKLLNMIQKMVCLCPDHRYANMQEVLEELSQLTIIRDKEIGEDIEKYPWKTKSQMLESMANISNMLYYDDFSLGDGDNDEEGKYGNE